MLSKLKQRDVECIYVNERWLRWYAYKLQDHPEQNRKIKSRSRQWQRTVLSMYLPKKEVIELKERMGEIREKPWRYQGNEENPGCNLRRRS